MCTRGALTQTESHINRACNICIRFPFELPANAVDQRRHPKEATREACQRRGVVVVAGRR